MFAEKQRDEKDCERIRDAIKKYLYFFSVYFFNCLQRELKKNDKQHDFMPRVCCYLVRCCQIIYRIALHSNIFIQMTYCAWLTRDHFICANTNHLFDDVKNTIFAMRLYDCTDKMVKLSKLKHKIVTECGLLPDSTFMHVSICSPNWLGEVWK